MIRIVHTKAFSTNVYLFLQRLYGQPSKEESINLKAFEKPDSAFELIDWMSQHGNRDPRSRHRDKLNRLANPAKSLPWIPLDERLQVESGKTSSKRTQAGNVNYVSIGGAKRKNVLDVATVILQSDLIRNNPDKLLYFLPYLKSLFHDEHFLFELKANLSDREESENEIKEKIEKIDLILKTILDLETKKEKNADRLSGSLDEEIRKILWIVAPDLAKHFKIPLTDFDTENIIKARYENWVESQSCSISQSLKSLKKEIKKKFDEKIEALKGQPKPSSPPKIFFVAGKPGSGKSTLSEELAEDYDAILVSPDDIKELMGGGACVNHELSVSLAMRKAEELLQSGYKVVFETTGTYAPYVERLCRIAKEARAEIDYNIVLLSPEIAARRVVARFEREVREKGFNKARFIEPAACLHDPFKPVCVAEKIGKRVVFPVKVWSNNVPFGEPFELIDSFLNCNEPNRLAIKGLTYRKETQI